MHRTLRLIWKYKTHYIIVIPAMLLIALFKLLPFVSGLFLAFKDYKIYKGIFGSQWAGFGNFSRMFADPAFRSALENTIVIKLEYIFLSSLAAFLLGLSLSCVRSVKLRSVLAGICVAPYFIPSAVFAYTVSRLLSPSRMPVIAQLHLLPLADERLFRPILVVVETFKTLGIPLILVLAAISYSQARQIGMKYRILPAVRAIAAFMLIQCSTLLTTDFELIHNLLNALTLRVGETLDMYSFRSVLQMGNYSIGGALWLLKLAVQLLFALLAYVLIKRWFISDLFQSSTDSHKQQAVQGNRETIGSVPALFFAAVVLGAFVLMLIYPFMQSPAGGKSLSDAWVTGNAGLYAGVYGMAAIVSMLVMLTLAYPLTVRELPGRRVYKFLLLLVIVVGTNSLPDFLLINSMGMINTVFPSGINGLLPIVGVFVLKGIFVSNHMERKEKTREQGHGELFAFFTVFIPSIWKPLVALGVLQFASLWNSYYSSMLYVADKTKSSPIMHFQMLKFDVQQMGIQAADPVILQYGAVLILPPLLLYILFHRWMTAEVFLSQSNKL